MQTLHIPANYDVWLTGLKHHLDRYRGSKAELARYLAHVRGNCRKPAPSSPCLPHPAWRRANRPGVDVFLDIAAWLQRRQDALNDPPVPMPMPPPPIEKPLPPRKDVTYRSTPASSSTMAEGQAKAAE
jgi:hypothetical protein